MTEDNNDELDHVAISPIASSILLDVSIKLATNLLQIEFKTPVEFIYNPIDYASELHKRFIQLYMTKLNYPVMFLGMNPGPWGMGQNGIPFGERNIVREWFGITGGDISRPAKVHHAKPIQGLNCKRSEVSGRRFWGLIRKICGTPEQFFSNCFVYNYCPLLFMDRSGRNLTPNELPLTSRKLLMRSCQAALLEIIQQLFVDIIVAIGKFAEKEARLIQKISPRLIKVIYVPHPSPRNPKNTNWSDTVEHILKESKLLQFLVPNG